MISSAYTSRDEHRLEHALRLVGLVDRQRVERRNQVADGVGDAHQEGVEALLGEDLVEDVREPPVRLDEGRIAPRRVVVEQPEMAGPDYHRSPNRSQFRCTFETPRSGPQRTDEASVRGTGHESLVRVNTKPDASGEACSRRPEPPSGKGPEAKPQRKLGLAGGRTALAPASAARERTRQRSRRDQSKPRLHGAFARPRSRERGVPLFRERVRSTRERVSRPSRSRARRRCPRRRTARWPARPPRGSPP